MRLRGRKANDEEPHDSTRAGAWYADPFEVSEERWWDGTKWTGELRRAPRGEEANTRAPVTRYADSHSARADRDDAETPRTRGEQPQDFQVRLGTAVGEELRVLPTEDQKRSRPDSWRARFHHTFHDTYDVLAPGGRAASISLFGGGAPRMECAEGAWSLKKRRRLGWDFLIETPDGRHAGWYSGRRWLPGGTISLVGIQVDLRRSFTGASKVQITDTEERFLDIRTSRRQGGLTMALTIRSLPAPTTDLHLLILTACAVLMLERMIPGIPVSGSGG